MNPSFMPISVEFSLENLDLNDDSRNQSMVAMTTQANTMQSGCTLQHMKEEEVPRGVQSDTQLLLLDLGKANFSKSLILANKSHRKGQIDQLLELQRNFADVSVDGESLQSKDTKQLQLMATTSMEKSFTLAKEYCQPSSRIKNSSRSQQKSSNQKKCKKRVTGRKFGNRTASNLEINEKNGRDSVRRKQLNDGSIPKPNK